MKWRPQKDRAQVRCYQENSLALQIAGIVLMIIGVVFLFLCIPGWAWAAVIGFALIIAGYLLVRFNSAWR